MGKTALERVKLTETCDGSGDCTFTLDVNALTYEIAFIGFYPTNQGTTYTFSVTNRDSKEVFSDESSGCAGDCIFWGMALPATGRYLISVDGNVADQEFICELLVR